MLNSRDRELGMHRKITRRDFINGVAVTAGAAVMPWEHFAASTSDPENSPNLLSSRTDGHARQPSWIVRDGARSCATALSGMRPASLKTPAKRTI